MAKAARQQQSARRSLATKPLILMVFVVLLSLATWSFFYFKSLALTATDTAVVVGFWLIVLFTTQWLWARLNHKESSAPRKRR